MRFLVAAATMLVALPILLFAVWHQADVRTSDERNARQRDVALLNGKVEKLRSRVAALEAENKRLRNATAGQQPASRRETSSASASP